VSVAELLPPVLGAPLLLVLGNLLLFPSQVQLTQVRCLSQRSLMAEGADIKSGTVTSSDYVCVAGMSVSGAVIANTVPSTLVFDIDDGSAMI
jgi:hypothetical protein